MPHKLIAHTKSNLVEFYGKIAEVAKLDDIFFQTHRSFVVNVSNVTSVDRTANMVFFEGDESCLLSRTRKKELFGTIEKSLRLRFSPSSLIIIESFLKFEIII